MLDIVDVIGESQAGDCRIIMVNGRDVYFEGCNVHIVNGNYTKGDTATRNGLGNLTVGYNEDRSQSRPPKTGSHNLIVGIDNGYSSYGTVVAGEGNISRAQYSVVLGGTYNQAMSANSAVVGGYLNQSGYGVLRRMPSDVKTSFQLHIP